MKKIIGLTLILLALLSLQCSAKNAEEGYESFAVTFEQDGKVIKPNGHVVNLAKKEFVLGVTFFGCRAEPVAVRLNTGINDTYYKVASNGRPVTALLAEGIGMAEPMEARAELILTDSAVVQYLFIDAGRSRFHEVKKDGDSISGKRYVNAVGYRGAAGSFPIQDLTVNELYMVFIKRSGNGIQQEYYLIQFPKPALSKQPLTAEQWLQQGMKYEQAKDFGLAIEAYGRALGADPHYNYQAYMRRANVRLALGRFDQALADCNAALAIRPDDVTAYFFRAYVFAAIGSKSQAYEDYSKIIALDPNLPQAYWQRATLVYNEHTRYSLKREDCLAVLDDLSKVIGLRPDFAEAYRTRGDVYNSLKEYGKALDDYNRAIATAPQNVGFYERRAFNYMCMGRWEEDWNDQNKIIELDPENVKAYASRAALGDRLSKEADQVIADYAKAIELYGKIPKDGVSANRRANLLYDFGNYLRRQGKKDEAIDCFTRGLVVMPGYVIMYHGRGAAYFEKGDYDRAIDDCTKAIELYGGSINPWTFLVRGKAYKAKGMYQEALGDFNTALKAKPYLQEAIAERDSLQ